MEKFKFVYSPVFVDKYGKEQDDFALKFGDITTEADCQKASVEFIANSLNEAQEGWYKFKQEQLSQSQLFYYYGEQLKCKDLELKEVGISKKMPLYKKDEKFWSVNDSIESNLSLQLIHPMYGLIAQGDAKDIGTGIGTIPFALNHCNEKGKDITIEGIFKGQTNGITMYGTSIEIKPVYLLSEHSKQKESMLEFMKTVESNPNMSFEDVYNKVYNNVDHQVKSTNISKLSPEVAYAVISSDLGSDIINQFSKEERIQIIDKASDFVLSDEDKHLSVKQVASNLHNILTLSNINTTLINFDIPSIEKMDEDIRRGNVNKYCNLLKDFIATSDYDNAIEAVISLRQINGDLMPLELTKNIKEFNPSMNKKGIKLNMKSQEKTRRKQEEDREII